MIVVISNILLLYNLKQIFIDELECSESFFFLLSQGGETLDARTAVNTARTV